jgi:glycosyltransferase involved in cell wall biosynthesis
MTARPWVSFVVPCFNEEDNVAATVQSARSAMPAQRDYEIILVDDCSTDRTLERMHALAKSDPRIKVVHNPVNLSLGGSYKQGVACAEGQYVIMIPGDDGFPGQSIREIFRHAGRADIVIPVATNPGVRRWFRAFASRAFVAFLNGMFRLDVRYYNGAVLHRTALLRSIEIRTNGFAYQAEALVKLIARGATYTQCEVAIQERAAGRSSALSLKNQITVWKTILDLLAEVGLFRRYRIGAARPSAQRTGGIDETR